MVDVTDMANEVVGVGYDEHPGVGVDIHMKTFGYAAGSSNPRASAQCPYSEMFLDLSEGKDHVIFPLPPYSGHSQISPFACCLVTPCTHEIINPSQ